MYFNQSKDYICVTKANNMTNEQKIAEEFKAFFSSMNASIPAQNVTNEEKRVFDITKYNLKKSFSMHIEDVTPDGYGN